MAEYTVNLERLIAMSVTVDVDDPVEAVAAAKDLFDAGSIDWDSAYVDQTAASCPASGDGSFVVISQKVGEGTDQ